MIRNPCDYFHFSLPTIYYRDSEICQLLLSPGRVAAKAREGRSKVLTLQHKLVWSKNALNASRLFTTLHDE